MGSLYLNRLKPEEYQALLCQLHEAQMGVCFICEQPIDLELHRGSLDVDHVEPLKTGGKDDPSNFALTHASCNRSKQASDLHVARVLARFDGIRQRLAAEDRAPNLGDVLAVYGGAKHELDFSLLDGFVRFSFPAIGSNEIRTIPVYLDQLSGLRYFFASLPIAYLHHDDRINPRPLGGNLGRLIEEFHRGRPQLHVALGWVDSTSGRSPVRVFDGQHKAAAQLLLDTDVLPARVFIDPDPDLLLTTNTNAGTFLRQVAFDKSVQRSLGHSLYDDRVERYRRELGLPADCESFSERDLVVHFKGESREMRRYILDAVRDAITHHAENKLRPFIELGGKATERPLSYSTIEKTFLSLFLYPDVMDVPLDYLVEEGTNPRDMEIHQVVRLMNIVAETIFIPDYDLAVGGARLESKVRNGEPVADAHLRAHRMAREEVMGAWLRYVRQIVQAHFNFSGKLVSEDRLFQYPFPALLWDQLETYVENLRKMPVWVNRELALSIFGGKQSVDFWRSIFETAKTPSGQQVLAEPIRFMDMVMTTA